MPYPHRVTVGTKLLNLKDDIVANKDINGRAVVEIQHTKEALAKDYIFLLSTDYTASYKNGIISIKSLTVSDAKFKYVGESNRDTVDYAFGDDDYALVAASIKDDLIALLQSQGLDVTPNDGNVDKRRIRLDTSKIERQHFPNCYLDVQFSASYKTAHGYVPVFITDTMKALVRFSTHLNITKENAAFVNGIEIKKKVAKIDDISFTDFETNTVFWSDIEKREHDTAPTYTLTNQDVEDMKAVVAERIAEKYRQIQFPLGENYLSL